MANLGAPAREKDPAQRGLYIVVTARASGQVTRTWQHRFSFQGAETFIVIGTHPDTSLERARHIVQEQREQLTQGIDPRRGAPRRRPVRTATTVSAAAAGGRHAVETLAHEFMTLYVGPNRKVPAYAQGILDRDVLPAWKGRDARTIKPREVIELLDGIVARGSRVMANRTGALLGQMFKFGIHREIVEDSPVKLLMRPGGKEKPRSRVLSDVELKAFLSDPRACTRHARLAIVIELLLLTAARRGELAAARWAHVDLKAKIWTVPAENSKTGAPYRIPLSARAAELFEHLKRTREGKNPWVLPGSDAKQPLEPRLLTRGVAKCLKRFKAAGIAEFTLHDLRRTARSGLGALRVAPHIAELCLNHAQPGIAGVYDHHGYEAEMREALELWAAHLKSLVPRSDESEEAAPECFVEG